MHGLILVDKPAGMSSMHLLSQLKPTRNVKIGHCGTLDPLASGLMLVLLGKATQLQDEFLLGQKTYSGTIKLGVKTDTDDILGKIISETDLDDLFAKYSRDEILKHIVDIFSGISMQQPPIFSAIHVNGRRSYKLAREGQIPELDHKKRKVKIEFLDLRFHSYSCIRFEVRCSKGTYIRSLARDIGEFFACGACIQSLRRIESTPYSINQAVSIEQIHEEGIVSVLKPIESAVEHLPRLELGRPLIDRLAYGRQDVLESIDIDRNHKKAAVFSKTGMFFGLIEDKNGTQNWRIKWSMPID